MRRNKVRAAAQLKTLAGGDRRSIGRSEEMVAAVLREPRRFAALVTGMFSEDPIVRMRSADAAEKISRKRPDLLQPYKSMLLKEAAEIERSEVRWHVAQMLPRLRLDRGEAESAVEILHSWLRSPSRIVQVNAMQALADLALSNAEMRDEILALVVRQKTSSSAAVRARARKLEKQLSKELKSKSASGNC